MIVKHGDPREMFIRSSDNPLLTAEAFPRMVNAVFNPGVVSFDGLTLLLVRVESRTGLSSLVVATSPNGVDGWEIDWDRHMQPERDTFSEHWGVEDPRITRVGDQYYIVYTGYGVGGPMVCLAVTEDFVTFERRGVLQPPEDKDAALFPTTFDGRWALIHRPAPASSGLGAHMWLSWSPDLCHWGDARILLHARRGGFWDANKIGLGPPPLATDHGWLICYHGVRVTASGSLYRLGLALLDIGDPSKVLMRGDEWIFGPDAPYERAGDVPDVVFPCGWLLEDDGDTLRMYYGAADSTVCLATASVERLLAHLEGHPSGSVPIANSSD
ncbi:MAG: glycosidase [Acidimicrobiia bacterium]|nr:glycosidase [Acidimicrobiia bacterium]